MEYKIIRSARRTISMQITPDGLVVRAPMRASAAAIDSFVKAHERWAEKHLLEAKIAAKEAEESPLTGEDVKRLAGQAKKAIPGRVKYFAKKIGVEYGRITIRNQKTLWGSCSAKGNLNFNCLLMLAPPEVIDSVVVHELCHIKHRNHSRSFYAEVRKAYPEYDRWNAWLTKNGRALLARMAAGEDRNG